MSDAAAWPKIAAELRERRLEAQDAMLAAIREEVELFARPLKGGFGRDVRAGTAASIESAAAFLEGRPPGHAELEVHRDSGRREVRLERPLTGLLAAYRAGQRALWRVMAGLPAARALGTDDIASLAETVMRYFDTLSSAVSEGYAEETAVRASELGRRDEALLAVLLRDPPAEIPTLQRAIDAYGWAPTAEVAIVVLAPEVRAGDAAVTVSSLRARLPAGTLVAARGDLICAVLTDPAEPTLRRRLQDARFAAPAVLGPPVPWTGAASSFSLAERALPNAIPGRLYVCDDHLLDLWLSADPMLTRRLADQVLRPLEDETPGSRAKLEATLSAFLDHHGHQGAMANALGLHQQTVRYRLGRLRDAFGPALDDPRHRLALRVALHGGR